MLVSRLDEAWEARGWRVYPFREYAMIGGVGFIHIPINGMGKPYGGKTSGQRIAADATFSIVHGHSHQRHSTPNPKINGGCVRVIAAGCALPQGEIEDYAQHSLTGWWYGCGLLTIRDGEILDEAWLSMETLERRYKVRKVKSGARLSR